MKSAGEITGIVLCGGDGRRFGGRDKPLLRLHGRPLIEHVLDRVTPQVGSLVISANRNLDRYRAFGYPVVEDRLADLGPLGGIESAIDIISSEWLFVCPGDAPLLPEALVATLLSGLGNGADVAIAHDGERSQHLFMVLRCSAARSVSDYLDAGGRSVRGWLRNLDVVRCPVADPAAFANVNTAADLEALSRGRHW